MLGNILFLQRFDVMFNFLNIIFSLYRSGYLKKLILLVLLCTKVIKVEKVENISDFFLDHLAFFFIPAGVGLLNSFTSIKDSLLLIILLCVVTTAIVIVTTGLIVQFIMNLQRKSIKKGSESK